MIRFRMMQFPVLFMTALCAVLVLSSPVRGAGASVTLQTSVTIPRFLSVTVEHGRAATRVTSESGRLAHAVRLTFDGSSEGATANVRLRIRSNENWRITQKVSGLAASASWTAVLNGRNSSNGSDLSSFASFALAGEPTEETVFELELKRPAGDNSEAMLLLLVSQL